MLQGCNRKWFFAIGLGLIFFGAIGFTVLKIYNSNRIVAYIPYETPEMKFKELISRLANTSDQLVFVNINFEHTLDTVLKGTALLYGKDYKVDRTSKILVGNRLVSAITLGDTVLNNNMNFINRLNEIFRIDVSICIRENDEFIRVASSLTDTLGNSGIGTVVSKKSPAYEYVVAGKTYTGRTNLLGKDYYAKYEPIIINGKVEGLFMLGVSYKKFMSQLYSVLEGGS